MRHAFLILVHNEPELFSILISLLDHPDCDFYIHVDKKADINKFNCVKPKYSNIYFTKKRVSIIWGHHTMVKAELVLYETAHKGNYDYYHLLSGVDMPLKPIQEILQFFEDNKGYDFLGCTPAVGRWLNRTKYVYFLQRRHRNFVAKINIGFQKFLGINRSRKENIMFSSQWGSFTHRFITLLLSKRWYIFKQFYRTFCCDEFYKGTVMYKYGQPELDKGCVRHIDWERGQPYLFRNCDFDELITTTDLFARKFASKDIAIVYRLRDYLMERTVIEQKHN